MHYNVNVLNVSYLFFNHIYAYVLEPVKFTAEVKYNLTKCNKRNKGY